MSYLVLARKYRPQTFEDVVGQNHITEIFEKAIEADRISHAYLLCGPRGTGKTSCARILAKSLNCKNGPTIKPCGTCSACVEIAKGTSFDVLEIDGASNRGIDEIRTIRENVKFAPSYGRYKIYIVDEVHMLTTDAFNALLKTLEEPPEHAKFIFATTEPNKVPATIISRCQRFDFKRVPVNIMVELLQSISEQEKLKVEQEALHAIAKSAQGGLRDALSVLDQLSALSSKGIEAKDVYAMLGMVETQFLFDLADALSQKDCAKALLLLDSILDKGKDIKQLVRDIIVHFRHLMVIKVGGRSLSKLVEYPSETKELLLNQCEAFTLKELIQSIDVFIHAQETARVTESMRMPLEVAFAKLTYQSETDRKTVVAPTVSVQPQQVASKVSSQATPSISKPVEQPRKSMATESSPSKPIVEQKKQSPNSPFQSTEKQTPTQKTMNQPQAEIQKEEYANVAAVAGTVDVEHIKKRWDEITHAVSKKSMSVASYLMESNPSDLKGNQLFLDFPVTAKFHMECLQSADSKKLVEELISEKLKMMISINLKIKEDFVSQKEEPVVRNALDAFGGEIVNRWHND